MRCFSVQLIPPVHLFKQKKSKEKAAKKKYKKQHNNKHHEVAAAAKKVKKLSKKHTKKIIIKILTFLMLCISLPIKMRKETQALDGNMVFRSVPHLSS